MTAASHRIKITQGLRRAWFWTVAVEWPRIGHWPLFLALLQSFPAMAEVEEVEIKGRGALYYTDDVAIFSATRRLSLNADPTQPALDDSLMGQGADGVFEPALQMSRSFSNDYGTTRLQALGDGYVFMDHTRFTHGTLRLEANHAFNPDTALKLGYYWSPDLYLGENWVRQPVPLLGAPQAEAESGPRASEVLTSHILSVRADQALTRTVRLQLLGRYGQRRYQPPFAERDLDFWTVGPHLEWTFTPELKWLIGYHFERGLADGRAMPWLADDVSYDNNYVSTEVEYELPERYQVTLGLHYEANDWLSRQPADPRYGTTETVYQGEVLVSHDLTDRTRLFGGFQYSVRSINTGASSIQNINVSLGVESSF